MTEVDAQLAASLSRRFRLIRQLGRGGMGAVFLAEQNAVGKRPVALKVLSRKLLDDPEFLLRFQNEAASTGRIHHANVVTIYESGQADDGTPYIAMEFLEGESLRQALKRRGALPVPEVAEILQQAARGLNAAHKLGIIHRDLKPDNIFLMRGDEGETIVKIVDFGIAKLRESGAHTQTGMVLGTPAYMSFEQASGMRSDELDARSDVYSLGVVVYEMLTGRTPFHSDTPVGYLRMHRQEAPPPFRTVKPDLPAPPQLENVVMKALSKDRDQRYGSALEFARELTTAAQPPLTVQSRVTIPPTRIVPSHARQPAARKRVAPMLLPATAQAKPDIADHTPPPVPLGIIAEPPSGQPQGSKPVAPSRPPAAAKPPNLPTASESPGKMKLVAVAGVALIIGLVAGVWYFSQHGAKKGDVFWSGKAGESRAETKVNPKDGLKCVWIPPGSFQMGCSPGDYECQGYEKPPHQVSIAKGFWLGQTEVTVGAYKRFAQATARQMPPGSNFNMGWDNMPIVNVTWNDAHDYCTWAGGRLPTEAEWEYAARGGSTASRYGPLDAIAWYADNSGKQRLDSPQILSSDQANYMQRLLANGNSFHEVGGKRPNGFGLSDMLGNVWEWVNDWYDENYYQHSPSQDPSGPTGGKSRVLRGGSWIDTPDSVRVSSRNEFDSGSRNFNFGVRCVMEVPSP